jgi:peptidyl-prolyl cis-trans isomerase C
LRNQRLARVALIGTITVAVSFPALTQLLRAQAAPAPRPAAAPAAAPAAPASGSAPAATAAATQPAGAAAATQPAKVDPNKVILQVGDEKLTAAEFDAYVSDLPAQNQALVRSQRKREFAELIIETKLLAHEAEKRKLQDDPKVKRQAEFVRQQVLANALAHDVQQQVDEAAIKKFFDEHKASLERVAARHILIRTAGSKVPIRPGQPPEPVDAAGKALYDAQAKAKADEIVKRLKAGEDFAKIARAESDDTGSAAEGGDLGSFTRGRMVPAFEQAAFALKEGEISQPVKSDFGWHVIQVTGKYDTLDKLGDETKNQIRAELSPQKMNDLIQGLKKDGKVVMDEAYFGPPSPEFQQGPQGPLPPGGEPR